MPDIIRILVLGGGYGGVEAAKVLAHKVGTRRDIDITLIDKNADHTLMTELHEVAGGRVDPAVRSDQLQEDLRRPARQRRDGQDTHHRLRDASGRLRWSAVPVRLPGAGGGGEPEYYGIPGIKEHSFAIWSFEDAMKIRRHIEDVFRRAAAETDLVKRAELLTFVIAGAGFTGIELAGELKDQRRVLCRAHHIDEKDVRIIVVEALDAIIPNLPQKLQHKAARYLEKRGVQIMLRSPIIGADQTGVLLAGNRAIATRTFVWTCGIQGCEFAGNLALTKGKCANRMCRFATTQGTCGVKDCTFSKDRYIEGKRGRLLVNEYMQSVDYPNVYVVGDVAWHLEGKKVNPQIVEAAVQTAQTAAHNIIAQVTNGQMKTFRSRYHGIMVSLGAFSGVAHVMGISLSGIFAIAVKHLINVVHLFGTAGVNQVWEYVKHEFLDVKNERSFMGGLASYKVRGYWPLLLRLWLGFMWVVESTNKITQGWLDFSSGKSQTGWMFSKGVIQAGLHVRGCHHGRLGADAASGAAAADGMCSLRGAAASAADATSAPRGRCGRRRGCHGAARPGSPRTLAGHHEDHPGSQLGLVTWFRRTFMDGVFAYLPYSWFQVMIVFAELLIGLALFGGLFTWWAAVVSIGMCLIFTLSGMFAWNQLWFLFAAILMMGGAGQGVRARHLGRALFQEVVERHTVCQENPFLRGRADKIRHEALLGRAAGTGAGA